MASLSVDPAEVAKFEAMAADAWDPEGSFKPLHLMNPCRLDYIADQISVEFDRDRTVPQPFAGLEVLDIGCGPGLLTEPMSRLGATVVGADAAAANIAVAQSHAAEIGLTIDYRCVTAEALAASGAQFDVVLAMEIVEHVADPAAFLATCAALLRPGGLLVCSTPNRTAMSFAAVIVGAEWVMRWLPKGTHDWSRFLTPDELLAHTNAAGLSEVDRRGLVFDPLCWSWSLSATDLAVNYVVACVKP